ncbi:MAG: hypothetical protein M3O28_12000 [Actinomycetota bacterium]|nr:hypothetical protein [Actinomycetota bacterium]
MASTAPRLPEQYKPPRSGGDLEVGDFHVSELAADVAGSLSPFGQELEFPLPLDQLRYVHPGPASRPHLADGR